MRAVIRLPKSVAASDRPCGDVESGRPRLEPREQGAEQEYAEQEVELRYDDHNVGNDEGRRAWMMEGRWRTGRDCCRLWRQKREKWVKGIHEVRHRYRQRSFTHQQRLRKHVNSTLQASSLVRSLSEHHLVHYR